jgi:putative oxidoreductase
VKNFFSVRSYSRNLDILFLVLRLVMGIAFMFHGFGKIQHPLNWMGVDAPVPGFFQALAAISEFGGGLALVLGLLSRLAAFGITCTMIVAVCTHMFVMGDPFVNQTGGHSYEIAAVYLALAVLFLTSGPGRFSLDRKLFGAKT